MIKVLLVDDHALFRQGLRELLAKAPDLRVAAEAGSYAQAIEMLRTNDINVVVADLSMPGRDGIDLISHARGLRVCGACVALGRLGVHDKGFHLRGFDFGDPSNRERSKLRVAERFRGSDAQVHPQ